MVDFFFFFFDTNINSSLHAKMNDFLCSTETENWPSTFRDMDDLSMQAHLINVKFEQVDSVT